ncbi:unnamed protein product [Vicia faba]|uniref:Uncharacterized protein n=1 Tax=Vicia faba TaxID=3906 RepID=A0AAV0YNF3_VICFA|nr:unnamed protein product [Vicia faba]
MEARDVKLLPKYVRGELVIHRTIWKKINERIMVATVSLKKIESEPHYSQDLIKASKNLNKTSTEADIHLIVEGVLQKTSENILRPSSSNSTVTTTNAAQARMRSAKRSFFLSRYTRKPHLKGFKGIGEIYSQEFLSGVTQVGITEDPTKKMKKAEGARHHDNLDPGTAVIVVETNLVSWEGDYVRNSDFQRRERVWVARPC